MTMKDAWTRNNYANFKIAEKVLGYMGYKVTQVDGDTIAIRPSTLLTRPFEKLTVTTAMVPAAMLGTKKTTVKRVDGWEVKDEQGVQIGKYRTLRESLASVYFEFRKREFHATYDSIQRSQENDNER